jgi:hypothetical protein
LNAQKASNEYPRDSTIPTTFKLDPFENKNIERDLWLFSEIHLKSVTSVSVIEPAILPGTTLARDLYDNMFELRMFAVLVAKGEP